MVHFKHVCVHGLDLIGLFTFLSASRSGVHAEWGAATRERGESCWTTAAQDRPCGNYSNIRPHAPVHVCSNTEVLCVFG